MSITKTLIAACITTALLTASCVMPSSPQSGGGSKNVLSVNGQGISAADLLKRPLMRQGLQQVCFIDTMWLEFDKRGYTVSEDEIEERMDLARNNALMNNSTFAQMLRDMHTTESDMRENFRVNLALDKLREDYVDTSEENLRAQWESDKNYYLNVHMRNNSLTDQERDSLTFEDVRETVLDTYSEDQVGPSRDALYQDLIDKSTLKLDCMSDPQERKFFEDAILNSFKTDYVYPALPDEGADNENMQEPPQGLLMDLTDEQPEDGMSGESADDNGAEDANSEAGTAPEADDLGSAEDEATE